MLIQILPNEILLDIYRHLSLAHLLRIQRVCKLWFLLSQEFRISLQVILTRHPIPGRLEFSKLYLEFPLLISVKPFTHIYPTESIHDKSCWMHVDTSELESLALSKSISAHLASQLHIPRSRLLWARFVHQSTLLTGTSPIEAEFTQHSFCSPDHTVLYRMPYLSFVQLLDFMDVHVPIDLTPLQTCRALTTLSFQSDGKRLSDVTGTIRAASFSPLMTVTTLSTLTFTGPWLSDLVDHAPSVIGIIERISNLRHLIVDLDYPTLGSELILSLFSALPHLKTFGRLGRVDKSFWRVCPKASGASLDHLILGTAKNPYSMRLSHNTQFCPDLGMGVLWFAPSIKVLEVWLGFNGDDDALSIAITRIKEGPAWELDETIQVKQLRKLLVFQVMDIHSIDDRAWKRIAEIPLSSRIEITLASQDTLLEGTFKKFGFGKGVT